MTDNFYNNSVSTTAYNLAMDLPAANNLPLRFHNEHGKEVTEIPDFYTFIKIKLDEYIKAVNCIDPEDAKDALFHFSTLFFKSDSPKLKDLIQVCKIVRHLSLQALDYALRGDFINAGLTLRKMLWEDAFDKYFSESTNLFSLLSDTVDHDDTYFRVRDVNEGEIVADCWHVPYEIRHFAWSGRFGMSGFPTFYLANDLQAACDEVGKISNGKERWYSTFNVEAGCGPWILDLTIPTTDELKEMSPSSHIDFIISYPLRLLCTIKASHSGCANSIEYIFAQILMHTLVHQSSISNHYGIGYTSTKHKKCKCLAIPAIMTGREPQSSGYSRIITDNWIASTPKKLSQSAE